MYRKVNRDVRRKRKAAKEELIEERWKSIEGRMMLGTVPSRLSCNSSGNTQSQSSQLAEPLWTDPCLKRGISLRKLISTKKKKKAQTGDELSNILPKFSHSRKKPPPLSWEPG